MNSLRSLLACTWPLLTLLPLVACGGGNDGAADVGSGPSSGSAGGGGASGVGSGGGGVGPSSSGGAIATIGSGGPPVETCDGVDNDGNGIVDDVDAQGDGVCDCILIATLGAPGEWGGGNVFASWLEARSDSGAANLGDAVLTSELLAPYHVIVALDVRAGGRTYSAEEIAALEAWVKGGGGLMTTMGYGDPSERANVNALLAPFGASYGPEQILYVGGSTMPVTEWLPHPVSQGVTSVGVDNGYPVLGQGEVVARGGGHDVALAQQVGSGHVFVWCDEWITYDSEWQEHPEYQVELFWLNAIKWLTRSEVCQVPIPK